MGLHEGLRMLKTRVAHKTNINKLICYKWTSIILVVMSASHSHSVEMEALSAAVTGRQTDVGNSED
jgi:hypothetical protein